MKFLQLPPEIAHLVLVAAVRARGIKRALRLRLVSRAFSTAATRAIFDSDVLQACANQIDLSFHDYGAMGFWHRYLEYRVLSPRKPLAPELRAIRRVAERIVRHRLQQGRTLKDDDDNREEHDSRYSETEVRRCIAQICHLFCALNLYTRRMLLAAQPDNLPPSSKGWTDDFDHQLFVTAAYLGEVDLVRDLLVAQGFNRDRDVFIWSLRAASCGGDARTVSLLLSADPLLESRGRPNGILLSYVIEESMVSGRLETLKLALNNRPADYAAPSSQEWECKLRTNRIDAIIDGGWQMGTGLGLQMGAGLEVFSLAYQHLIQHWGLRDLEDPGVAAYRTRRLGRMLGFLHRCAVSRGDTAFMAYLLDKCPLGPRWKLPTAAQIGGGGDVNDVSKKKRVASRHLYGASRRGQADAVAWLLSERGASPRTPGLLARAAQGGSLRVLEMVLAAYYMKKRSKREIRREEKKYIKFVGGDDEGASKGNDRDLKEAVGQALEIAVRREHDAVVQRLLELARDLGSDTSRALEKARADGLESMVALLQG